MLVNYYAAKCTGIDALKVTIEICCSPGIGVHLSGLADTAVKESLMRTVTALQALGYNIPGKRITINLAPADLHKNGTGYDLPIALGILHSSGQIDLPLSEQYVVMGELGLDGSVREIEGGIAISEMCEREGLRGCILPYMTAQKCARFSKVEVLGVRQLNDVIKILSGNDNCDEFIVHDAETEGSSPYSSTSYLDFSDIIGQETAKRAAEIAVAGGHNMILIGSPGSGKSSIAKAMAGILPPMTLEESRTVSKIMSAAGKTVGENHIAFQRPFRSPHYSTSIPALIGGGSGDGIIPGEVSLAHCGILYLDEFPQMSKSVMESLRAPLEDRSVTISRLRQKVTFPASFTLVGAANPCPCGYYGDGERCVCTPGRRQAYLEKLSGPLMDRIDLQVFCNRIEPGSISMQERGESSSEIAQRVRSAREVQAVRFRDEDIATNAEMNNKMVEKYCVLSDESRECLDKMMTKYKFSMRAYYRIIKVARTIADLYLSRDIASSHILEACAYRILDKEV